MVAACEKTAHAKRILTLLMAAKLAGGLFAPDAQTRGGHGQPFNR
jgi:hypothetical protein